MANGEKFIECPTCESGVGFYVVEPNISPFACLLLKEGQKKPAANPKFHEDARVSSSNDPSTSLNVPLVSQELEAEESQPDDADSPIALCDASRFADDDCMEREEKEDDEEESRTVVTTPSKPRIERELHDQSTPFPKLLKRKSEPAQPNNSGSDDEGLAIVTPPRKKNRRCTNKAEAPVRSATLQETESKSVAAAVSHQKGRQRTLDGFFGLALKQDAFVDLDSDDESPRPKQLECSVEEHKKLKSRLHWIRDFQSYLMNETTNSTSNISRVMEQANLLQLGAGIKAPQWRASFMEGYKVNLTMDFDKMLEDAKDFEEKHGKDKGRGWKLQHPIRKICKFQKFVLDEEEETIVVELV
jgi:hypothetical protein